MKIFKNNQKKIIKLLQSIDTITTKLLTLVLFVTTIPLVVVGTFSTDIINQSVFDNAQNQLNIAKETFNKKYNEELAHLSSLAVNNIRNVLKNDKLLTKKDKTNLIKNTMADYQLDFVILFGKGQNILFKEGNIDEDQLKSKVSNAIIPILQYKNLTSTEQINSKIYQMAITPILDVNNNVSSILAVGKSLKKSKTPYAIKNLSGANVLFYKTDHNKKEIIKSNFTKILNNTTKTEPASNNLPNSSYFFKNTTLLNTKEFNISIPLLNYQNEHIAQIYLGIPKENFIDLGDKNVKLISIIAVISLVVSILIAALFARTITTPILTLAEAAESINLGNLDFRPHVKGSDETAKLANSFRQMVNNIKHQEQLRDNFVATLTHDLKVPMLAENQTISYFLKEAYGPISEEQRAVLELIRSTNNSSLEMIGTLLEVYRYDCGNAKLFKVEFNIVDLLKDSINQIKSLAEDKKINIIIENTPEEILLKADQREIKRVLHNIISNSINNGINRGLIKCKIEEFNESHIYKPQNSADKYTTLKEPINLMNNILVTVEDNGIGIAREDMSLLFKRFSLSKGRKPSGTGLGLYYSFQVINQHNGLIWAESSEKGGAIVKFIIPFTNG